MADGNFQCCVIGKTFYLPPDDIVSETRGGPSEHLRDRNRKRIRVTWFMDRNWIGTIESILDIVPIQTPFAPEMTIQVDNVRDQATAEMLETKLRQKCKRKKRIYMSTVSQIKRKNVLIR